MKALLLRSVLARAAAVSGDGGNTRTPLTSPFGRAASIAMAAGASPNGLDLSTDRGQA